MRQTSPEVRDAPLGGRELADARRRRACWRPTPRTDPTPGAGREDRPRRRTTATGTRTRSEPAPSASTSAAPRSPRASSTRRARSWRASAPSRRPPTPRRSCARSVSWSRKLARGSETSRRSASPPPASSTRPARWWSSRPTWLARRAAQALLEEELGLPVVVENDANAAAWGEFTFGAGEDVEDLLMLTVGTGVGGGVVIDGELVRGASASAAEVGHITMVPGGVLCGCGNHGCLESYGSGTALVRVSRELAGTVPDARQGLVERAGGDPEQDHRPAGHRGRPGRRRLRDRAPGRARRLARSGRGDADRRARPQRGGHRRRGRARRATCCSTRSGPASSAT